MPRAARKKSKNGIYHILLRGINKQSLFEDEEDFIKFKQVLAECKEITEYKLFAYCLMNNHIHLLLKEEKEDLGLIFKRIGVRYAQWYNRKYKRTGHLFQDRFKSEPVEDEGYFVIVLRYIHQNPLKAKLCKNIDDYKWSSHGEYLKKSQLTDIEFPLSIFNDNKKKALQQYIEYMNEESNDNSLEVKYEKLRLTDEELKEIIGQTLKIKPMLIHKETDDDQAKILRKIKEIDGISLRQIARITGFTVNKVFRA